MSKAVDERSAATLAVGRVIRNAREDMGLTQGELALLANMPRVTYQRYEKGNRESPIAGITKIARALGIPLSEIMRRAEGMEPAAFGLPDSDPRDAVATRRDSMATVELVDRGAESSAPPR
jgi:transcriptional regulator with XRE-family HTH domain